MDNNNTDKLIFVYNADSGLFNTLTDIAHKALSPGTYQCNLCAITHGLFKENTAWREHIESLEVPVEFLHRDEFEQRYSPAESYPLILHQCGNSLNVLADSSAINRCRSVEDLVALIT